MYKVPLTNSPNQTFSIVIPVNGENINFTIFLSYNENAKYWLMTLTKTLTQEEVFCNLPLLCSFDKYSNMIYQLDYKEVGEIMIVPIQETQSSMPNDEDIGIKYVMVWGDNT